MAEIGHSIEYASDLLNSGEIVAFPTETVYGLGGNALDSGVVAKIFAIKNRPSFNPLIVHCASYKKIYNYVKDVPKEVELLAEHFWPGPLTILLPKSKLIPDIVTAGLDKVAVRCPSHKIAQQLLNNISFPLAAPSANPFGYVSPVTAKHVQDELGNKIKFILDGGTSNVGIESTILGWENNIPTLFRLGGITVEQIQKVIGRIDIHKKSTVILSSGQLASHYSPRKKFIIGDIRKLAKRYQNMKIGLLSFKDEYADIEASERFILSTNGDTFEAARNIFTALRQFDQSNVEIVLGEKVPNHGLGSAINDRLNRAVTSKKYLF